MGSSMIRATLGDEQYWSDRKEPERVIGDALLHAKPYARLLKAIDAPAVARASLAAVAFFIYLLGFFLAFGR